MTEPIRDCTGYDEDLSAWVDGELDPGREAEVRAHLEGCERCRGRMTSFARGDDWLRAAPLPEVSPVLRDAVLRSARGPESARKAPPRRLRWIPPALGALAAAAAAIALYLAFRGQEAEPPGSPAPSVARQPTPPQPEEPAAPEPDEQPPPTLIAEPLLPPALPPPPKLEIPVFVPELEAPGEVLAGLALEEEPAEDLAAALLGVEQPEDVDVIANLEILEQLLALEEGRG